MFFAVLGDFPEVTMTKLTKGYKLECVPHADGIAIKLFKDPNHQSTIDIA